MKKRIIYYLTVLFLFLFMIGVTVNVEAASIKLNKSSITITTGLTKTLKATVSGKSSKVTWSSSNTSVAKVSSTGKITAVKNGSCTITAKANGVKAKCKVKVVKPTISMNVTTLTLTAGKSKSLYATITGKTQKATWSSSDKSIAKVGSTGKVTAVKKGTCYIYAKANGVTAKCKITVKANSQIEDYAEKVDKSMTLRQIANKLGFVYDGESAAEGFTWYVLPGKALRIDCPYGAVDTNLWEMYTRDKKVSLCGITVGTTANNADTYLISHGWVLKNKGIYPWGKMVRYVKNGYGFRYTTKGEVIDYIGYFPDFIYG